MLSWPPATTMRSSRLDLLHAERDRAQARTADLIDAPGRRIDRNAGANGCLARGALAPERRQNLAEDDLRDVARREVRPLKRRLDRNFAEL